MDSEQNSRAVSLKELENQFAKLQTMSAANQPSTQEHSMGAQDIKHQSQEAQKEAEPIPETQESRDSKLKVLRIVLKRMY
ncbi:hypothetical protein PG996_011245 [Apiospora saccharicola]|uniref:Uncharacterized protein n=1 Tax=Apiospora saccharicola TaxID=335842 RepID=A0ABR1UEI1_9PEZI